MDMMRKLAKRFNGTNKVLGKQVEKLLKQIGTSFQDEDKEMPNPQIKKKPFDYQQLAIENVVKGFEKVDRGQLILPCGAGKTLVSLWVHERLDPRHTLVLFPSLALLRQTKNEWSANRKQYLPYICVCSEKDIDAGTDSIQMSLSEIDGNVSTELEAIRDFLQQHERTVIFSTYQSLESVSLALKGTNIIFDLALCDEAHKTAGTQKGAYSLIHDNSIIPTLKRLYMTATPRVISQGVKTRLNTNNSNELSYIADMSDPKIFGPELYCMSFKEAIDRGILVDYKIVAIGVTDSEIQAIIKEGRLTQKGAKIQEIANNYALGRFMEHYGASSVISFHSSVKKASEFRDRHLDLFKEVSTFHVNGKQSTNERHAILDEFAKLSRSVVTNARCLTEGVDIPVVDAVFFGDPKNSKIDIVQAAGRALRRAEHRNKAIGYIVVPLFHRHEDDLESVIDTGAFSSLLNVIRGLSNHDERIRDVIRRCKHDTAEDGVPRRRNLTGGQFQLIELAGVVESLKNRLFEEVINNFRLPWKTFEGAREFVHSLNLKGKEEWFDYNKSGERPSDIPAEPSGFYKDKGWISWGDWLGTGRVAPQNKKYRTIDEAKEFAHSLKLKYRIDWKRYIKNTGIPDDIPICPDHTYKDKGWVSWPDWLGSDIIPPKNRKFLSLEKARLFVHNLKLKSQAEWRRYSKSSQKPDNIPADPHQMYKNKGWVSWGDWLGTGRIALQNKKYRSIEEAKSFVHSLALTSRDDWNVYCKSGNKPSDIPAGPSNGYKDKGWISWGDWLGTGRIALQNKKYRTIDEAKSFVHKLGLKSGVEWSVYCKSGNKPTDIPAKPSNGYKDKGWISMVDWLGTDEVSSHNKQPCSFEEAQTFVQNLGLKNVAEWREYCKSGNKPENIPADPKVTYKNKGWISWKGWLGAHKPYKSVYQKKKQYKSFEDARSFVHSLHIKSQVEWILYCKSGNKPTYIPVTPHVVYKNKGWVSLGDWLGTYRVAKRQKQYRSFVEARTFVRSLDLKSHPEWRKYCKSGNKPEDIPVVPNSHYKQKGWVSIEDWLGIGTQKKWRSFEEARLFARSLGLKSQPRWFQYCKSGQRPNDIPSSPGATYQGKGWVSWGDWLGTGTVVYAKRKFRSFEEARMFVRSLGLKSLKEWKQYCSSGNKPIDIPSNPNSYYKEKGWVSWMDWLGTGSIVRVKKKFRSFEEARMFARSLGLKSYKEWKEYRASENKPSEIPSDPESYYKGKGWVSWMDWLG